AIPRAFIYPKFISEYSKEKVNTPFGILHIGEDKSYIVISYNHKLEFYRELPLSVSKLKEYLSGKLALETGEISLSEKEAEELLFDIGIPQGQAIYKGRINSTQILAMLRPGLERLTQEIKRSLNYYQSELRPKLPKINSIFLGGKAKSIPNLEVFLSQELALNTNIITAAEEIKISSPINRKDCFNNIESLGIILDYKRGVNILPYEFRTEDIEKVQKISLRWITFIISLFLIVSYFFTKVAIRAYRWQLDNALLHLNVISEVKKMKTDRDEISNFISDLKAKEPLVGQLLKVLSFISDREVFFNKFTLDSETKSGIINGFVKSTKNNPDAILANFADRMGKSNYFSKVEISSVKKKKEPPFEITEFNLNFEVP
nr:pilus assembly protein PilM [Candidatus Omnitrophota bacterium]